jgi:fatty aldehyde-generating acyl-ACP reductase
MKRFVFSATYQGDPQAAIELLLQPQSLLGHLPYVHRIDLLESTSPETSTTSWEVEIDGASLTWRQETRFIPDQQVVQFKMVKGDFRSYEGEWVVCVQNDQVKLSLHVDLDWGAPNLSQFVAQILEKKAERALRGMVLAVARASHHKHLQKQRVESRFGFVFHPLDIDLFAEGFGDEDIRTKRPVLLEQVMTWFPPFRRAIATGFRSAATGVEIEGDMILCPLLPKQILTLGEDFVLAKLVEACRLAERYGDKIVGLGAYAANVGRKGVLLAKQIRIPITTGSSYTIAIALEATLKASQRVGIDLNQATVAIIGATGTIGRVCANLLAREARHLLLVARNPQHLEDVAQTLDGKGRTTVLGDLDAAISNADIVIVSTNTPSAIIDVAKAKPGTVICDISRPRNVSEENALLRPDVLVLDGGVVRPPGHPDFHFSFGLAPGLAYACMAETIILAMEGRFEPYSLGGNVDFSKVREIALLGRKHGFALAGLRSFGREVSDEQIERIRLARKKRRMAHVRQ